LNLRRTLLAAAATAATSLTLLAAPVAAQPDHNARPVEAKAAAAVECHTGVIGFTGSNKLIYRTTTMTSAVGRDYLANRAVPFRPSSAAYFGGSTAGTMSVLTLNTDGRPRAVTYAFNKQTRVATLKSTKVLLNRNFRSRLIASSGTFHYYMVDPAGTLRRWTAFRNDRGQLFFDKQKAVKSGQGNLKTLSFYTRARFGGVLTDVLVGTTKQGALKQFRIPANRPGAAKVITLRSKGFKRYSALSLSQCLADGKLNPNHAAMTAIDAGANLAHFYTLKPFLRPAKPVITHHGKVAPARNWRLHATF
jgi:hypothetical protein